MELEIITPDEPLRAFIDSVIYYRGYTAPSQYEVLLPDGKSQLIIALDEGPRAVYRGGCERPLRGSWFTGLQTGPLTFLGEKNAETLCVRFTPMGLFTLLKLPLIDLLDGVVEADSLLGDAVFLLRERLILSSTVPEKMALLSDFFLGFFQGYSEQTPVVRFALQELQREGKNLGEISEKSGYSQKQLIAIFKNHIGISPKRYQRLLRFNRLLRLLNREDPKGIFPGAGALNFYDQPHLIREFKSFSRLSPSAYRKRPRPYPHVLPLDALPFRR